MTKKEKKDQFIIAYIADFNHSDAVLSYSIQMAQMLQKGLILMHICDQRYSSLTPDEAESRLKAIRQQLLDNSCLQLQPSNLTYATLKGDTRQVLTALPQLLNAVTIVAAVVPHARRRSPLSRHAIMHNFADCKTAFLVVQKPLADSAHIKDVAMTVDFKKESKDKFIWSSYFPRFGNCRMHVLHYDYRDQFLHAKWQANMTQLTKLYDDLDISFEQHSIQSKSTFQDINALRFAHANDYDLLIAVTTKEKDGFEFFFGVQELRTLVNREQIPILFLNPREDLYVLCD